MIDSLKKIKRYIKEKYNKIPSVKKKNEINRCKRMYQKLYSLLGEYIDLNAPHDEEGKYMILSGESMEKLGIFCDILAYIKWCKIADELGYKIAIDMKNVPCQNLDDDKIGKENAWEYYFEQPSGETLEKAYLASERFIANRWDFPVYGTKEMGELWKQANSDDFTRNIEVRRKYRELYKKYIKINKETEDYIQSIYDSFKIGSDEKVLGLLCRGTDYFQRRPYGHAIQPTPEQIAQKVRELMTDKRIDRILVTTEDANILEYLKEQFGEKVITVDCARLAEKEETLVAHLFDRHGVDRRQRGLDYIASVYLLARCDYLIAGETMATGEIFLIRDKDFEYEMVWNLGKYGIDDVG